MIKKNIKKINKDAPINKGSLLLELLIVISLIAIILSVSANAMFLSMRSNKHSGERDTASALASEALEAVRAATEEDWQNIYLLTKNSQYHPVVLSNKWTLNNTSSEQIIMNGTSYTRYITVDNVSRDPGTRNIQINYSSTEDDPSTQKVTAVVSWSGGVPVSISEYFFRWKNKVCDQSGWATGGTGNTVKNCGDTTYDTKDAEVDITGGVLKLQ